MFAFCVEKRHGFHNLRNHRAIEFPRGVRFLHNIVRNLFLFPRLVENNRSILRSDIVALPIDRGWVVNTKEVLEQRFEGESSGCPLYTSDAADDLHCGDLGGRRSIKKKKQKEKNNDEMKPVK